MDQSDKNEVTALTQELKTTIIRRLKEVKLNTILCNKLAANSYGILDDWNKQIRYAESHLILETVQQCIADHSTIRGLKSFIVSILPRLVKPKLGSRNHKTNYNRFTEALQRIHTEGIEKYLLGPGRKGNPKYDTDKDVILALVHQLWREEFRRSKAKCYSDVKVFAERNYPDLKFPAYSTFTLWHRSSLLKHDIEDRVGKKKYAEMYAPSFCYNKPAHASDVWELDGTRYSIAYFNPAINALDFLSIFLVVDVFSRKIIGVGYGDREDHQLVMRALQNAVKLERHFPRVIVGDNSSALKHSAVKAFFQKVKEEVGTTFIHTPPNVSQAKSTVESIVYNVERVFNEIPGFLGHGVDTTSLYSRLSPEAKAKTLKAMLTREEIIYAGQEKVIDYNKYKSQGEKYSPKDRFKNSDKPDARAIDELTEANLFWLSETTSTVYKGKFTVKRNGRPFKFIIDDHHLWIKLSGTKLEAKLDIDSMGNADWGKCIIFQHGEYLGTASPDIKVNNMVLPQDNEQQKNWVSELRHKKRTYKQPIVNEVQKGQKAVQERLGIDVANLSNYITQDKRTQYDGDDAFNLSQICETYSITNKDKQLNIVVTPVQKEKTAKRVRAEKPREEKRGPSFFNWDLDEEGNRNGLMPVVNPQTPEMPESTVLVEVPLRSFGRMEDDN